MEEKERTSGEGAVMNISKITCANTYYRREIWTGEHLQLTVMAIPSGGEIGLELHEDTDQFLRVEYGCGDVYMGKTKQSMEYYGRADSDCAVFVPAGTWHNVINNQKYPLKLYSVYAPPHHPVGTVHKTKFDSDVAE